MPREIKTIDLNVFLISKSFVAERFVENSRLLHIPNKRQRFYYKVALGRYTLSLYGLSNIILFIPACGIMQCYRTSHLTHFSQLCPLKYDIKQV